ncbi:hypothetical protein PMIN03_006840 [Paraphaeosphaeria minitans]|uniref:Uncharacterized protein n=1 Tax=Paraphaeosphaeria minitans TaxID=565426 RepID=A0A9P6KRE1_9PLEO|nr:hypothetical protein PMIN01_06924 [Paraphaeosphaeria minitans]
MGKKRTSDGEEKHLQSAPTAPAPSNDTPPAAQAPRSSTAPSVAKAITKEAPQPEKHKLDGPQNAPVEPRPCNQAPSRKQSRKKLPRLPPNASITKRPLHHPAIPTPFASSDHPKTIYISHSTPFVPTLKRIRRLLLEISKRQTQSQAAQPRHRPQGRPRKPLVSNGRLAPEDVERDIAEEGRDKGAGERGEDVYVKATGRAIERALRIGVHFQGESDCRVTVEMGSVMAVDDIELRQEGEEEEGKGSRAKDDVEEEVPETRVRMVSSVTVAVGLR